MFLTIIEEIRDFGFSIKHFNEYSNKCLAGENTEFIQKYMSFDGQSIFNPADANEIFGPEERVDLSKQPPIGQIAKNNYSNFNQSTLIKVLIS